MVFDQFTQKNIRVLTNDLEAKVLMNMICL